MYQKADRAKLLLSTTGAGEPDLPRNPEGVALIGDPRNDENVIVSQLQVVIIRLHNKFVDHVRAEGTVPSDMVFAAAQRLTRWHYQRVIVDDYLRRLCGEPAENETSLVDELMHFDAKSKRFKYDLDFYLPRTRAYLPVEFSVAGFRFGHSQVRGVYDLNENVTQRPIFAPSDQVGELDDLRGGRPLPAGWTIDWSRFLTIDGSVPQPSRKIDAKLVTALFDLPGSDSGDTSLAFRNLKRGQALELPSGQDIARHLGIEPVLTSAELGVEEPTPLWFYLLKESELGGGTRLGPVGARIVAEVLIGLIKVDTQSWANQEPTWHPVAPRVARLCGMVCA